MPPALLYDLWYRLGAPWEVGPGRELASLLRTGRLPSPDDGGLRAADLGCGSGANVELLARHGYRVLGIDQSSEALRRARRRLAGSADPRRVDFLQADLGDATLADRVGTFDLLVDYGALNDQSARGRRAFARTVVRLARPGAHFVLWAWHAPREVLPWLSLRGPSRLVPHLEPGEEAALFGADFAIERLPDPPPRARAACFLMTRRDAALAATDQAEPR